MKDHVSKINPPHFFQVEKRNVFEEIIFRVPRVQMGALQGLQNGFPGFSATRTGQ